MNIRFRNLSLILLAGFMSCCGGKDPEPGTGSVQIAIDNLANGSDLVLSTGQYTTKLNHTFSVSSLDYLLSNFKLYKDGALKYTHPNSYFLIEQDEDESKTFQLDSIPDGEYDEIRFSIGVDAAHNNGSASEGDLSPNNGLFWASWGSYIFYRLNGEYHNGTSTEVLAFHIGGDNNYAELTFDLAATPIVLTSSGNSTVHIDCEITNLFQTPNDIDISSIQNVANEGTTMDSVAANYSTDLFSIDQVVNP